MQLARTLIWAQLKAQGSSECVIIAIANISYHLP